MAESEIYKMVGKEYIEREKNRLVNFCRSHNHVYIYGAGKYGKRYFDVLKHKGVLVDGFIITGVGITEYCGLPVHNINDASVLITEQDGIIPAYLGSSPEEIMKNFRGAQPDILSLDHKVTSFMEYEMYFSPIMEELKREFPSLVSIRECSKPRWKDLLVIRLDAIGDVVCTTAFIRELKQNYPEGTVTVVIRKQNELLLKGCPYIDNLILYESELNDAGFIEACRNFNEFKEKVSEFVSRYLDCIHFDAVFLARDVLCGRNAMEEFLMAFYSKAKYRVGHLVDCVNERAWLYDMIKGSFFRLLYQKEPTHETLFMLDMLKGCGLRVASDRLELWPSDTGQIMAKSILSKYNIEDGDKLIAVGLVGSLPVKNWSVENYNKLISMFYERYGSSYKFVIFGGKDAAEVAGQLAEDTGIVVNLTGKLPLDVTIACMKCCDLYVGSDTGLMHIATALDKPSVTLYRELGDSTVWYGYGPRRWGARRRDSIALLPTSGLDGCHVVCQKKYSHCINQITPHQVLGAIEATMNEKCDMSKMAGGT